MKKGRPGTLIRVICTHAKADILSRILSEETGTLGIRCIPSVHRSVVTRTVEPVEITLGGGTVSIPVKTGWIGTEPVSCKAEYDVARREAGIAGVPLKHVTRLAEEKRWKELRDTN
jgi:hypothetical protein